MKHSDDGQYAVGIQYITCPPSPELRDLPTTPKTSVALPTPVVPGAPVYVTIAHAAAILCVSKDTIRNRIRAGVLPALRLKGGQTVLIDLPDVLGLLEPIPVGEDIPLSAEKENPAL